ncbi:MAG: glutathione synthase [Gammaproteobacteria bacterium]|nr:glutathione synthase [Gammaproteobacteria bacterium]HXK55078.1 glutathione synthase [Gammaproteobacteria bacterium]
MTISLGVVMDPIESINIKKDSTFAMLLESQRRGWNIWYMQQNDLFLAENRTSARMQKLSVEDNPGSWFSFAQQRTAPLDTLDVILMRKDPPFDMEYIYTTYLLENAEKLGCLIINSPSSLRDCNEKLFTSWFPQCCPETLVSRNHEQVLNFVNRYQEAIIKPLGGMGGASIFRAHAGDPNLNVIIETLTGNGRKFTMVQRFIPEIRAGDKRILMVDGQAVPYALARIPKPGENRGNLAVGGKGVGIPLSERDRWIASQVAPVLKQKSILFAGLDVIGDYLTEINVTSPTCIRELDAQFGLNISAQLLDSIMEKLQR